MSLLLLFKRGAALGLIADQLGISTTAYSSLRAIELPAPSSSRVQHICSNSTAFPTKSLGYLPATLAGTMLITGASVDAFVVAVLMGTAERRISFLLAGAEHYCYAYAGDVTAIICINPYGTATRQYEVSFSFPLSRSQVYDSATDAVLWGG